MIETELSDQPIESAEPPVVPEAQPTEAAPAAVDPTQFLEQLSAKPLAEAEAELKALAAEQGQAAVPALTATAQKASLPLACKAIDALATIRSGDAADALAAIGADRSNAQRAKEARRALHKLNLAGIKAGPVIPAPRVEPEPDKVYACMASPIDGGGNHTLTIVRQNKSGTLSLAVFMLNEGLGITDAFGAVPCSMSLWKRYLAEADDREQKLAPVELSFCQQHLEIAAARNERTKTHLPDRYYMFAGLAMGASEERQRPAELHPDAIRANPDLLARSADLFDLPECKTWLLDFEAVRPHALKMIAEVRRQQQLEKERQQDLPVMDLGQLQRQGTVTSVAMSALFDGARRAAFRERLQYTADILWRSDRLEEARLAMAAALALAPESTLPVDQHPFLRQVTQQSLLLAVQAEEIGLAPELLGREGGEATEEKKAEPEEYVDSEGNIRRKSGLILPR